MKPIIKSQKHYVQMSLSSVAVTARNNESFIKAVSVSDKNTVDEVEEGAIIKAVYVELWVLDTGNDGSNIVVLAKHPQSGIGLSFTDMNALGVYDNKKNVLFTHQGLSPNDGVGNPVQVMGDWYKIPKSKQRFGLGDSLVLSIANNNAGSTMNYCGFATYKEYT